MNKKNKGFIPTVLFILLYCISSVAVVNAVYKTGGGDYLWHLGSAKEISFKGFVDYYIVNPYPMWHILCKLAICISSLPEDWIVAFVTTLFSFVAYIIVNFWLTSECKSIEKDFLVNILTFALFILGPLYLPRFNPNYYLGQGTPNTWHNPTNLTVRPFAILTFIILIKLIEDYQLEKKGFDRRRLYLLSFTLLISVWAKPSFIMMVIPGVGLFMIVTCYKDRSLMGLYLRIILAFIPAVILFLSQYVMLFVSGERGDAVGIGWLTVLHMYTSNVIISFLLAFAFPIYWLLVDFKDCIKDVSIQLGTCCVCSGWLEMAVLLENGIHRADGNFFWGYYIAMFFMWLAIIRRFILSQNRKNIRLWIGWILLVLHIIFGIYYILHILYGGGY